jgi:hypothetical protein
VATANSQWHIFRIGYLSNELFPSKQLAQAWVRGHLPSRSDRNRTDVECFEASDGRWYVAVTFGPMTAKYKAKKAEERRRLRRRQDTLRRDR